MTGGPRVNQIKFELFQTYSNLTWSKQGLLEVENFERKYGFEDIEMMNNFFHRNFFRFEVDFELKFKEVSMSWNKGTIDWNFLGT
jgi:hypothetical protein